jgi:hypothetical protein
VGRPSGWALLVLCGDANCMHEGILILNEIWAQDKIIIYFGRHFALLKYFTYHSVLAVAPNNNQHILSPAKYRQACY